jgi:hypothetical protein
MREGADGATDPGRLWPSSTVRLSGCCRLFPSLSSSGLSRQHRRLCLEDALRVVRALNDEGKLATIDDVLGERSRATTRRERSPGSNTTLSKRQIDEQGLNSTSR